MKQFEFRRYLESIGFKYILYVYRYGNYEVKVNLNKYYFFNGSTWFEYKYNDITRLKNIERSIKLKKLLK